MHQRGLDAGPESVSQPGGPRRDRDEREGARHEHDEPPPVRDEQDLDDHRGVAELEQEDRRERGGDRRACGGRPFRNGLGAPVREPERVGDQARPGPGPDETDPLGTQHGDEAGSDGHRDRGRPDEGEGGPGPGSERMVARRESHRREARPVEQFESSDHGEHDQEAAHVTEVQRVLRGAQARWWRKSSTRRSQKAQVSTTGRRSRDVELALERLDLVRDAVQVRATEDPHDPVRKVDRPFFPVP